MMQQGSHLFIALLLVLLYCFHGHLIQNYTLESILTFLYSNIFSGLFLPSVLFLFLCGQFERQTPLFYSEET